jgi:hypothetical protein
MKGATKAKGQTEPDRDTSMDGGLCRLDPPALANLGPPALANLDDDEVVAPLREDNTED